MGRRSIVLFHKLPAIWESDARAIKKNSISFSKDSYFSEVPESSDAEFLDKLKDDIFYMLTESLSKYLEIDDIHVIIGHNKDEVRNWDVISRDVKLKYKDKFTFWSVSSVDKFPEIPNVEVLILRGNYPHLHNDVIDSYAPKTSIFYPATSLFFPNYENKIEKIISNLSSGKLFDFNDFSKFYDNITNQSYFSRLNPPELYNQNSKTLEIKKFNRDFANYLKSVIPIIKKIKSKESVGKYSIVLFDELSNLPDLKIIYPNSTLLPFKKASSPLFYYELNVRRDIDIIFTGSTIQKTKNFDLSYHIVDELLSKNKNLRVVFVGSDEKEKLEKRWKNFDVEIYGRISKEELSKLFNRSRIHLVTSGRDCFPRTIPESIVCGCFNICLDILSDGNSFISNNPLLGKSIDTSSSFPLIKSSYNVSLVLNKTVVDLIFEELSISRDHFSIATLGKSLLSIDEMIQFDMIWQDIDLQINENY